MTDGESDRWVAMLAYSSLIEKLEALELAGKEGTPAHEVLGGEADACWNRLGEDQLRILERYWSE